MKRLKMYHELAEWFPLLTAPPDYAGPAETWAQGLEDAATRPIRDVLILGAGAGNTAGHLKTRYNLTLADISEEMLAVSRLAHPECTYVVGDMRTLRLKKKFDAVLLEDAIMYITTEEELAAVFATAFAHVRAGGSAVFSPDDTTETFRPGTSSGGHDGPGRSMRYLEWTRPAPRGQTKHSATYVYVLREGRKPLRVEYEDHEFGLFPHATWIRLIEEVGFEVRGVSSAYDEGEGVMFAAHKPRGGAKAEPFDRAPLRETRICSRCGTTAECAPGGIPPGWSLEVTPKRAEYLCADCARRNIRAIEGRLPEEWWE